MSEAIKLTDAQNQAAHERLDESLALRSGAGCGKTRTLAVRFNELLMRLAQRGIENPLSRLVALTFTDKAALEMKQRVRSMLADFAARAKGDDRKRMLAWLDELPSARISTIHGFCVALLRSHAVEAGLDPDFAVCADALAAGRMLDEAADQAALAAVEAQQSDVLKLLASMTYDQLAERVADLVSMRGAWQANEYADPQATLARWRTLLAAERARAFAELAADAELKAELEALADRRCDNPADKLLPLRDELVQTVRELLTSADNWTPQRLNFAANFKPGNVGKDATWGGEGRAKELRHRLKAMGERFAQAAVLAGDLIAADESAAAALATLTQLAVEANRLYSADKRRRGMLDFDDLLIHARRLLESDATLRRSMASQIEQLLIDEAQDTDAAQVALLSRLIWPLAGDDDMPAACPGGSRQTSSARQNEPPPPGRLLLVGDEKQSIYRFRGAQVEVFTDLCDRIGSRGQIKLNETFRTHAAGAEFINHVFAPLMGDLPAGRHGLPATAGTGGRQGAYEPIIARRTELPTGASVEILLAEPSDEHPLISADDAVTLQAAVTAQRIKRMIADSERRVWDAAAKSWRPVRASDVAVLLWRMTQSLPYERELTRLGVPYYVVAGTGFFHQQEVFDVLNAMRAVDNPYDDLAFIGVLRGGIFGLDDHAIMRLTSALPRPLLPSLVGGAPLPESLPASDAAVVRSAVSLLRRLHARKDAVPVDALLEELLAETGFEAVLLSRFNGRRLAGNVRQLVELARSADGQGAALADFITQMGEQVIRQNRYEQAAVAGEGENVVRLMSIHKAKGLEFPVVFVPELSAGRRQRYRPILNRPDWGLTLNLKAGGETDDTGQVEALSHRVAKSREIGDERAEDVRTLYVAMTRHQDHLVLVGADWRDDDGEFTAGPGGGENYLHRLDEVLGISAAADAGRNIPYGDGRFEAAVRKVAPEAAERANDARPGQQLVRQASTSDELAKSIRCLVTIEPPSSLGPIPPGIGRAEFAVTALGEFQQCPMRYRWQYELRTPSAGGKGRHAGKLDAATLGTIYHRCMEQLDFSNPRPPLDEVRLALAHLEIDDADAAGLAADLADMLARFRDTSLWRELADARRTLREVAFLTAVGPVTLRGQIDMLYQDAAGGWHVVDYKSDRVESAAGAAEHAARYELQMLVYALSAGRHLGTTPVDATLYFLRSGLPHAFTITPDVLAGAESRIAELCKDLLVARRSGLFSRRQSSLCDYCPHRSLCVSLPADV